MESPSIEPKQTKNEFKSAFKRLWSKKFQKSKQMSLDSSVSCHHSHQNLTKHTSNSSQFPIQAYREEPFDFEFSSYHDFVDWKAGFSEFEATLTTNPQARKALEDYTSDMPNQRAIHHSSLNFYLRTKTLPKNERLLKKHIIEFDKTLESILKESPLPTDTIVYRKISKELLSIYTKGKEVSTLNVGDTLIENGYMSTTLSKKKAMNLLVHGQIILKIKAPKGTNAAYLNGLSFTKGEEEVLFLKGQNLKITHIRDLRDLNRFLWIDCELMPRNSSDLKNN